MKHTRRRKWSASDRGRGFHFITACDKQTDSGVTRSCGKVTLIDKREILKTISRNFFLALSAAALAVAVAFWVRSFIIADTIYRCRRAGDRGYVYELLVVESIWGIIEINWSQSLYCDTTGKLVSYPFSATEPSPGQFSTITTIQTRRTNRQMITGTSHRRGTASGFAAEMSQFAAKLRR